MDPERIKAIGNWAFLKVLPRKEESAGGIVLVPSKEEKVGYCSATVLSLGPGRWCSKLGRRVRPDTPKVGDKVFVRKYLTEVNPATLVGHTEYCFLDQQDLIAEVNEVSDFTVTRI